MSATPRYAGGVGVVRYDSGSPVFGQNTRSAASDKAAGITRFIASTDAEDRALDVVSQTSWNLAAFRANPVILAGHDSKLVVGTGIRAEVVNNQLEVDVKWDMSNPDVKVQSVGHQHLATPPFRKACSVGFRAGTVTERDRLPRSHRFYREPVVFRTSDGQEQRHAGLLYENCELLELSSVAVGMNAEALQRDAASAEFTRALHAATRDLRLGRPRTDEERIRDDVNEVIQQLAWNKVNTDEVERELNKLKAQFRKIQRPWES